MGDVVILECKPPKATIILNDPQRRNALGLAMFDALDAALERVREDNAMHILLLRGDGPAFCAGFDLAAAVADPHLMSQYIHRLSAVNRTLRRMPQVVVVSMQGAAIAGGCAMLSACDFVVAGPNAKLGYPVHRLGVSPAVTIPTLAQAIGPGAARELLMGGELIDGRTAHRLGLATHLARSDESVLNEAEQLCNSLAAKGPHALRVTKRWLNELDGSLDDNAFDGCARASAQVASGDETQHMLRRWVNHTADRTQHKHSGG